MNKIFEFIYPEEFNRHPFTKRTYQRDQIIERIFSSNIKFSNRGRYCWNILNKNGCTEYRSDFESPHINYYNLCWFTIENQFYCFSRDWTEIYLLDNSLNKKTVFPIENPIFTKFNHLYAGHSTIKNEIPFLFGYLWNTLPFYYSVLKIDFKKQTCKWLFKSTREWLLSTYWEKENPKIEIENIDNENFIYPLRTYSKITLMDDLIWNGEKFILKMYKCYNYYKQRPNYSLVEVNENGEFISYGKITEEPLCYSYPNKYLFIPPSYKDHLYLLNNHLVLGTPNSFYDNTKKKYRKYNNQYLWDINKKEFVKVPLPKEFKEFYIHFIKLNDFMTISKYDKIKNETLVINLDLKTTANNV